MNRTQRTRNRQDYTPQVRATRPPTSPHLSEIKRKYVTMVDTATATELIAAVTDRKIRIVGDQAPPSSSRPSPTARSGLCE